jgi:hypothetical protein
MIEITHILLSVCSFPFVDVIVPAVHVCLTPKVRVVAILLLVFFLFHQIFVSVGSGNAVLLPVISGRVGVFNHSPVPVKTIVVILLPSAFWCVRLFPFCSLGGAGVEYSRVFYQHWYDVVMAFKLFVPVV